MIILCIVAIVWLIFFSIYCICEFLKLKNIEEFNANTRKSHYRSLSRLSDLEDKFDVLCNELGYEISDNKTERYKIYKKESISDIRFIKSDDTI